ncbi:hypothetical protein BGZ57DRAFT_936061 [Hyaloscypha finlandica]|nr:hypothetical protein BGZ57DRAFT_936061 [Hyaloscypha finlandica]
MKYGYNPETYAGLPTVSQNAAVFTQKDAEKALNDCGKVFFNHSLQKTHGLVLLHRHFQLTPEEFMVEYRGTATAWPINAKLPVGAAIRPTTWAITDGALEPYEFEFIPGSEKFGDDLDDINSSFVQELYGLLQEKDLLSTFGLVKLPTGEDAIRDAYEITIGRASVTFPGGDMNKGVGAMWRFEEDGTGICARVCSQCRDLGDC